MSRCCIRAFSPVPMETPITSRTSAPVLKLENLDILNPGNSIKFKKKLKKTGLESQTCTPPDSLDVCAQVDAAAAARVGLSREG